MENEETMVEKSVWGEPVAEIVAEQATETVETQPEIQAEPVAETVIETVQEPVIETGEEIQAEENTITPVTEKTVEKIIEKYPEFANEDAKALYEAFLKGDEDNIYDYLNQKRIDYNVMSDYDVVKRGLKGEHPDWTDKRLDLEFKTKYDTPAKKYLDELTEDTDEYDKAVAFNDAITQKEMLMEMQAEDYRIKLNAQKKEIQLPKIQEKTAEAQQPTAEQIAEASRAWEALVSAEVPKVSNIRLNVNGEEVTYKITDTEKTGLTETMKNFSAVDYLTARGWFDQDGNANVTKITEDVYQLENISKITSSVATKTANATKKAVVSEIKNVDLTRNGSIPEPGKVDAGEIVWNY